jgi:hypothetical protein
MGKNHNINDRPIAPQLGPLHEKVRISRRTAAFFGIFPRKTGLATTFAADPRSLACDCAMRETKRPDCVLFGR